MMPDLGKYGDAVLSSYAVSILLIVILVAMSIRRARKMKTYLAQIEERQKNG